MVRKTERKPSWNYLRVRGEYFLSEAIKEGREELPPRARRIPRATPPHARTTGTTSACAENTVGFYWAGAPPRNYLRVRGEYQASKISSSSSKELPPRARRIQEDSWLFGLPGGTTSACAENTAAEGTKKRKKRNYLRVRGEYAGGWKKRFECLELPPRARRIQTTTHSSRIDLGTTSACAENTLNELGLL